MAVEQGKLRTPEENYEDAALELALYRMLRHEHEMVKANSSEDDKKETQRIAAESTPRIFALIERHTKRREGNSFKRQSARFLKAVACVVLVANMGLTIATATSAPVRAKVMDFLTEINASYMSMGFRETELEIDVPENWEGSYYPTFLPEGYMLQFSESDKGKNEAEYTDVQGETLRITECNITVINRINTENAEVSHVKVHGVNATVLKQPYIGKHPESFQIASEKWKLSRAWVNSLRIIRPESVFFQEIKDFQVDIAVEAGIRIEEVRQSGGLLKRRRAFRQPLRLRYSFDLRPCRMDCRCLGAILDEKESLIAKDRTGITVDKYLIPVLKDKDYAFMARVILYTCMPEQLDSEQPFDPERWIREMGLTLKYGCFPENGVLGEYFFGFGTVETQDEETGEMTSSDINPGTVVINRSILRSEGSRCTTPSARRSVSTSQRSRWSLTSTTACTAGDVRKSVPSRLSKRGTEHEPERKKAVSHPVAFEGKPGVSRLGRTAGGGRSETPAARADERAPGAEFQRGIPENSGRIPARSDRAEGRDGRGFAFARSAGDLSLAGRHYDASLRRDRQRREFRHDRLLCAQPPLHRQRHSHLRGRAAAPGLRRSDGTAGLSGTHRTGENHPGI